MGGWFHRVQLDPRALRWGYAPRQQPVVAANNLRRDLPIDGLPNSLWRFDERILISSLTCLLHRAPNMSPLTQSGRMAARHWREFLPKLVRDLETKGQLQQRLLEAEEKTKDEMATLRSSLMAQGLTADQAHRQAWETVRQRYLLLAPET